jgi:hypothetical protein
MKHLQRYSWHVEVLPLAFRLDMLHKANLPQRQCLLVQECDPLFRVLKIPRVNMG